VSDVQKISVAVTTAQLEAIKKATLSGDYASTSEVIREALRGWQIREPLRKAEVERLRKAWDEGLTSGPVEPYDLNEILEDAENRLAKAARKRA
jgi:antitoxin ParD1/3/4